MSALAVRTMSSKWFQPIAVLIVSLFAFFLIPPLFSGFWVKNFTQTAVFGIVAASAGMLYGRVGLVSLGQVAPYGIGCWICMRFAYATDLPYPLLVLFGGIGAAIIGTLIGLPALRVSGLYLALVTLMLAAAVETLLFQFGFPNGGTGFKGVADDLEQHHPAAPPVVRRDRRRLLPLRRGRHRDPVRARVVGAPPQARPSVGIGDAERTVGAHRRHRHHALQAGRVHPRIVHGRLRRRAVRRQRAELDRRRPVQPAGGAVPRSPR